MKLDKNRQNTFLELELFERVRDANSDPVKYTDDEIVYMDVVFIIRAIANIERARDENINI